MSHRCPLNSTCFTTCRFVSAYPMVLDYECFEMAMQDAKRIMPQSDMTQLLRNDPDVIMSLMKGKSMIVYDHFDNPWS